MSELGLIFGKESHDSSMNSSIQSSASSDGTGKWKEVSIQVLLADYGILSVTLVR